MVKHREVNGMVRLDSDGNRAEAPSLNDRVYKTLDEKNPWKYNFASHSHNEWDVLDSLVKEKTGPVRKSSDWDGLHEYVWKNPNNIDIIQQEEFFMEHFMPKSIPSSIKSWDVCLLEKWDYKWIIFDMPGAEVKVNWHWIAYNKSNELLIKSQNPMTLEWRINAAEAAKFWDKNLKLKVIPVDDQWNGLNIEKEVNIKIENDSEDE